MIVFRSEKKIEIAQQLAEIKAKKKELAKLEKETQAMIIDMLGEHTTGVFGTLKAEIINVVSNVLCKETLKEIVGEEVIEAATVKKESTRFLLKLA